MTTTEIYNFLKTWINQILNVENNLDLQIIRGEQNAPRPSSQYIAIHQPMNPRQIGSGNYGKADSSGNVEYAIHYEATISIEEVGGSDNGDNLRLLIDSKNRQDIKDLWRAGKISLLRNEDILPIPQMSENIYELRSILDLIILFPNEGTYIPGLIEAVEFTGTYEGTVN